MKKKLLALLVGFLAASSLSACGKTPEKTENTVTCGDGVISGDEKCDIKITAGQPGACPQDENDCGADKEVKGKLCQAECVPKACGNGDIDNGELCDPNAKDPAKKCISKKDCTKKKPSDNSHKYVYSGNPDSCTAKCEEVEITCDQNKADGACPSSCTRDNDVDCAFGAACTGDANCSLLGNGAKCLPSPSFKDGFCSVGFDSAQAPNSIPTDCTTVCPASGKCAHLGASVFCSPSCEKDADCRQGYFCSNIQDPAGEKTCLPKLCEHTPTDTCADPNTQCDTKIYQCRPFGSGTKQEGEECKDSSECPGGFAAYCFKPTIAGGYCTKRFFASLGETPECSKGFADVSSKSWGAGVAICAATCTSAGVECNDGQTMKSTGFKCENLGLETCVHEKRKPIAGVDASKIGIPCTDDTTCTTAGAGSKCLKDTDATTEGFDGAFTSKGYCSAECDNEVDGKACPSDDTTGRNACIRGNTKSYCLHLCKQDSDCNGDYSCSIPPKSSSGICLPKP